MSVASFIHSFISLLQQMSKHIPIPVCFFYSNCACYRRSGISPCIPVFYLSGSTWRCPAVLATVHIDHRHPISTKIAVFNFQRAVFLLLDCLLLDIAPSLSPVRAYGTTYRLMSPQHHLCSPLDND